MPMRRNTWIACLLTLGGLALGLWLNRVGLITWDDAEHLNASQWLVSKFGLAVPPVTPPSETLKWYGPLWPLVSGLIAFGPLAGARDPLWAEHGLTFALFPLMLWLTFIWLRRAQVERPTAWLVTATLFGLIRLGGHAMFNIKDFPFACGFWLVTLGLWDEFRTGISGRAPEGISAARAARLGLISVIPYLLRPPVALHAVLAFALLAWALLGQPSRENWWRRLGKLACFPAAALAAFAFITPALWEPGGGGAWLESLRLFSKYPLVVPVRFWGINRLSNDLPWWYALSWIPVLAHPLALAAALSGLRPLRAAPSALSIGHSFTLGLRGWIGLVTAGAWAAVLLRQPVLYDEERHILFLFVPLFAWCVLGTEPYRARWRGGLAALIALASCWSYASWGRYAYVYKSPVIGDTGPARFMGDYWGLCAAEAVNQLQGRNADLVLIGPASIAPLQLERLRSSAIAQASGFEGLRVRDENSARRPVLVIGPNRSPWDKPVLEALHKGLAKKILEVPMPDGSAACTVALFE